MAKKPKSEELLEAAFDDPEMHDEKDPVYRNDAFSLFKYRGIPPEGITTDIKFREEYRAWLKKNP